MKKKKKKHTFIWGYGHFFIFVSIAAAGAALAAAVDVSVGHADISDRYEGCIIALTVILYSISLWLLRDLPYLTGFGKWFYPVSVIVIFAIPFMISHIGYCVFTMAIVFAFRLVLSKWLIQPLD